MRILIIHPNLTARYSWAVQSVLEEVENQSNALMYGWRWKHSGNLFVPQVEKELGPFDVVITGDFKYNHQFEGIGSMNALKVIFLGDYLPRNFKAMHKHIRKNRYDIAILRSQQMLRFFQKHQNDEALPARIKAYWFPWSVDTKFFDGKKAEKSIDIMAVFATVSWAYPRRRPLQQHISKMSGVSTLVGGVGKERLPAEGYRDAIVKSKIFACANGEWNEMTLKYFECLASGTFMLTERPNDFKKVGLIDGEHLVLFNGLEDFEAKARYYLEHEEERERIAKQGQSFVREKYSCEVQAAQLLKLFERERGSNGGQTKN